MRGRLGGMVAVAATLGLAAPALAGTTIDTTGFAGNTPYPFTSYSPGDMSSDGSEAGQTFVAPAGAQTLTTIAAVLSASSQAQNAQLSLWSADDTGPLSPLQTTNIVIPSGTGLREFPVSWTVAAGGRYAFVFGVADAQVTADTGLTLPNVGGVDARNVYDGGWVFTRNDPPPTWTSRPDIDVKFRLDFDGGATGGGGGGGGGTTTPPVTGTTPAATTPTPAPGPGTQPPALPAGKRTLKAAKGRTGLPATVTCTAGTCTVALTAPKGARSAKVRVLRGKTLAGSASATFPASRKATRRKLTVKPKVPVAGSYTVELTVVTASGRKVVVGVVLRA